MQHNKSIAECFDSIDVSKSTTVKMGDLESALIRF
jgi:Ca2+-binding EF-hand superfamily protein